MALTDNQRQLLNSAKKAALEIGEHGKALANLVGELSLCDCQNLQWQPTDGYDALAPDHMRVQIKTRKSWTTSGVNPSGRVPRFGRKSGYQFDRGELGERDQQFEVAGVWEMSPGRIEELRKKEKESTELHISTFKKNAQRIIS